MYHSYSMCKLLYAVFDLSTLKTLYHSYIYLKCIFWHSRHCTIHISITNASFDTQDIVPFIYLFKMHLSTLKTLCHSYSMCKLLYAVFDLSTLKTLYHSYSMCKLLYAVFDLSTLKTLYHSYIYLKCIFWHSRHCTIHISITNASFDTQDVVPFIYLFKMHLSTLKTLYHSYIYYKCIFRHSRHCTIHISI